MKLVDRLASITLMCVNLLCLLIWSQKYLCVRQHNLIGNKLFNILHSCFTWWRFPFKKKKAVTLALYTTQTNKMHNFLNYLIFNFCCLLHVSNLLGSSSGRHLYMQYVLYMHWCEAVWWVGDSHEHNPPIHETVHTDACKTYHTAYTVFSLRMNPRSSKHVGDYRN